jgi:hypothetical protein
MVSVYSAAHFLVDFACAFLMFRGAEGTPDWYLCVLLYNFCAFAMQMPLGVLADQWDRNSLFAAIGCVLVGAAFGLRYLPVAAAVTLGVGNGMFHVGAGVDVLNISEEKSGALGVFISPGAFGIYLDFPWKNTGCWGAVLICAVVLGKTAGGFAADRFGLMRTSGVSLGLAAALLLVPQVPAAGVLSVLLLNMTAPVTFWAMAKIFPGAKGFSFGLLTFGLFLGFLPVHSGVGALSAPASWLFAPAAAVSLALFWTGTRMGTRMARL